MLIAILILIFIWNIICFERGFFVHSINEPLFIVHSIEFLYWLCFVGVLNIILIWRHKKPRDNETGTQFLSIRIRGNCKILKKHNLCSRALYFPKTVVNPLEIWASLSDSEEVTTSYVKLHFSGHSYLLIMIFNTLYFLSCRKNKLKTQLWRKLLCYSCFFLFCVERIVIIWTLHTL